MPYEVENRSCVMADGTEGSAIIYKLLSEGGRERIACHINSQSAYSAISQMEENEKMTDEMKADLSEESMVHFIDGEEEGIGVIESVDETTGVYHIRVQNQTEEGEYEPTDEVVTVPFDMAHDLTSWQLGMLEESLDELDEMDEEERDEVEVEVELPSPEAMEEEEMSVGEMAMESDEEMAMDSEEEMAMHGEEEDKMDEEEKMDDEEEKEDEEMMSKAIEDVDLRPTKEMADEATRGLEMRAKYGRGGTEVGVARARDISNRKNLSAETVTRMNSYFARHKVDLEAPAAKEGNDGYPSAGLVAWKLWGGDAGEKWASRKVKELERAAEKIIRMSQKAEPDELSDGDFVKWESAGGEAQGRVVRIERDGTIEVPDSDFTVDGTQADPAALIEVYDRVEGGWLPNGVHVAHPFSMLTRTEPLPEASEPKRLIMAKMKEVDVEIVDGADGKIGTITGYASTYGNTDLGGDVVERGAFKQTLNHKGNVIPLLLDHGYNTNDVAGIATVEDTEKGLMMKGEMPLDIPEVANAFKRIKFMLERGGKMGLSIGYDPVKTEPAENGTRKLKEISLHEVSITPFPMNTEAQIMSAKNRKAGLEAKRKAWQTIRKPKVAKSDAPTSNRNATQDALKALDAELKQLIQTLTY